MVLIGAGQGLAFAPLTSFGIRCPAADAGAASGLVNTAHQLGMPRARHRWSRPQPPSPSGGPVAGHLAAQATAVLTTGSVLLPLALGHHSGPRPARRSPRPARAANSRPCPHRRLCPPLNRLSTPIPGLHGKSLSAVSCLSEADKPFIPLKPSVQQYLRKNR